MKPPSRRHTAAIVLLLLAQASSHASTNTPPAHVRFDCRILGPVDPANAVLEVTYENTGDVPVCVPSPHDVPELYRGVRVLADGKAVPLAVPSDFADHVHFTNQVTLTKGQSQAFQMALGETWRLPATWTELEVRRGEVHLPWTRPHTRVIVENAAEGFRFDSKGRRLLEGATEGGSAPEIALRGHFTFTCALAQAAQAGRYRLECSFKNTGSEAIHAFARENLATYRGLELTVDGKPVPWRQSVGLSEFVRPSQRLAVPPGVEDVLQVDIDQVWVLPADWQTLEVVPKPLRHSVDSRGMPCARDNASERFVFGRDGQRVAEGK